MCGCGGNYPQFQSPNLGAASPSASKFDLASVFIRPPVAQTPSSPVDLNVPVENGSNTYVLPPSGGAGTPS